jgi:hypothetical protein
MFEELEGLFLSLKSIDEERIKSGHYPSCKDARYLLIKMRTECQVLRKSILNNWHLKQDEAKKVNKSQDESKKTK